MGRKKGRGEHPMSQEVKGQLEESLYEGLGVRPDTL